MENLRDILTKQPWRQYHTGGYGSPLSYDTVTQADFIRQYHPYSHQVFDRSVYPDIYREVFEPVLDEEGQETGKTVRNTYVEHVPRYAFAFQQIITLKQLIHTTGNDTQFDLDGGSGEERAKLGTFRTGWSQSGIEYAWFKFVESVKRTGDGAVVGYFDNGVFGVRHLSYFDGSILYPQYDPYSGRMNLFARQYSAYDARGGKTTDWVEVWDDRNFRRYRMGTGEGRNAKERILGVFGINGYELVESKPHGFPFLPVVYYRDPVGACWTPAQGNCDGYDIAFSQLSHNNKAYGFPILGLKGDNIGTEHDLDGTIKMLTMGPDDDAKFLSANSASENFLKELDTLYKMIYETCFTVTPPSLKSGDLPAAALKILYSPAYEKAITDSQDLQPALDSLVKISKFGIGLQNRDTLGIGALMIKAWIKPYVHINESAVMQDLAVGIQNGFISRETASERASFYTSLNEKERLAAEAKKAQERDLLYQYEQSRLSHAAGEGDDDTPGNE